MGDMNIDQLASQFKALSEPVRLRILYLLLEHDEVCVCDLVQSLSLTQSVVSRHLAYLKNNQLIESRREGTWVYYKIKNSQIDITEQLLTNFADFGKTSSELSQDLKQMQTSTASCC